jgi:hypothetical protein
MLIVIFYVFYEDLKFLEVISLMELVENFGSGTPCRGPECHAMSKAFSISRNTVAVRTLLLKF